MLTPAQELALSDALYELNRNFEAAWARVHSTVYFDADALLDTSKGSFQASKDALEGSRAAIELLRGPLLEAARGLRPWPLDEPNATVDAEGALDAWQRLAGSVRAAIDGVKGYAANWSALELLRKTGGSLAAGATAAAGGIAALLVLLIVLEVVKR